MLTNTPSEIEWTPLETTRDSDHCPIILTMTNVPTNQGRMAINFRKIDLQAFKDSEEWRELQANYDEMTGLEMVDKLYQKLKKVIEQSTPEYKRPFFPKPWWSVQLADSLEKQEKAFRVYGRRRSPQNLMKWKRIRAEHRRKVADHK